VYCRVPLDRIVNLGERHAVRYDGMGDALEDGAEPDFTWNAPPSMIIRSDARSGVAGALRYLAKSEDER